MSANYISVSPIADSTPGFSFGRSGACTVGTYLQVDSVPSNLAGRLVAFSAANLSNVFVSCQSPATFTIEVQVRVGAVFTTVYTATITASRKFTQTGISGVEFLLGDEVCVKIGSGSCSNVIVGLIIKGSPL
jgi:hypothetical protein